MLLKSILWVSCKAILRVFEKLFMTFKVTVVCILMFEFQTGRFLDGLVHVFATYNFYWTLLEQMRCYREAATAEMNKAKV